MNLYDLAGTEQHPIYQQMETANNIRQYGFMYSMIDAAINSGKDWLPQSLVKALNFHAIVGLHDEAGEYRSHEVVVGDYEPPPHYKVPSLMADFVSKVNRNWETLEPTTLAARALWGVNHIHPFVNGNGRTARAVCYFVLGVKSGGQLPGQVILPDLLRTEPIRSLSVSAMKSADIGDFSRIMHLVESLTRWQLDHP